MSDYVDDRQSFKTFGLLSLRRRWKLIVACVLLSALAGGLFLTLRGASYTASTQFLVYVKEVQPGSELVISLGRADLTQVENEIELIRSRGMLAKVVQSLDLAADPEFVPARPLSWIAALWPFGVTPTTAVEERGRQEIAIDALAKRLSVKRIGTSHTILVDVTTSDPEKSALIARDISQIMLQARVSADQEGDRSPLLRERLQGLGPSVYVMTPALVPGKPSGPRKILVILAAAAAGFVIGSGLALLKDLSDKTVRTAAQVERFGLECIGAIPSSMRGDAAENGISSAPLLAQTLLRMTVAVEAAKARIVGVASPTAGEGAASVARQFAQAAAGSQRKVLLVEARGQSAPGSRRENSAEDFRQGNDGAPDILTVASCDDAPGFANWWTRCEQQFLAAYDLIVVGLPPLEQGPAFRTAAQHLDGVLLVMKWGGVAEQRIERAFSVAGAAPSDFIGAVLNQVDGRTIGQFGDLLWKAEASVAERRRLFAGTMPAVPAVGSA